MNSLRVLCAAIAICAAGCSERQTGPADLAQEPDGRFVQLNANYEPRNQSHQILFIHERSQRDNEADGISWADDPSATIWIYEVEIVVSRDSQEGKRVIDSIDLDALGKALLPWLVDPSRAHSGMEIMSPVWPLKDQNHPKARFRKKIGRDYKEQDERKRDAAYATALGAQQRVDAYIAEKHGVTNAPDATGYPPVRRVDVWMMRGTPDEIRTYLQARFPDLRAKDRYLRIYDEANLGLEWKQE